MTCCRQKSQKVVHIKKKIHQTKVYEMISRNHTHWYEYATKTAKEEVRFKKVILRGAVKVKPTSLFTSPAIYEI